MIKGVKFNSINENISKHSYKDFGLVLTEQNIGVPTATRSTLKAETAL